YPLFSVEMASHLPEFRSIVGDTVKLFFRSNDLLSPIYIILIPIMVLRWKKIWNGSHLMKMLFIYCALSLVLWAMTTSKGGSRFILSYLPAWSVLASYIIERVVKRNIRIVLICAVFAIGLLTVGYRGLASVKYVPVLFGQESKQQFLLKHLNFSYGDFYDVDGRIRNIARGKTVLVYGGHNFFYMDFPFVHVTAIQDTTQYELALVINVDTPKELQTWKLLYEEQLTYVRLYQK
ncbi:MAG TPA: hypothetical protein VJ246_02915, partial [Patescibacteria group bacterium]|nr:hypothetical protein [Patescibacteria group bacterium]